MIDKYESFKRKRINLDNQKSQLKDKISGLNKEKLKIKIDKFNQQRKEAEKMMNKNVAGPSSFDHRMK